MYVTRVKTLAIEAVAAAFDDQYPVAEFRGLHCSLEYPVKAVQLPEVWVRYSDTAPLRQSGVAHVENTHPGTGVKVTPYTRWKFEGSWEFVIVALSSVERDRVYDELIATIAWSGFDSKRGRFRQYLETNDLINLTLRTDEIESTGENAEPGTPWGTDEVLYERTLNVDMIGDFVPDPETGLIVPLSKIQVVSAVDLTLDGAARGEGFGDWH
ncbi:hypothetical protein ACFQ6C_26120 [Streptomyces sp. NPDC056454]|uniref:hypothetical protein n=1 Tax=Streptomyces sp. NPDC056454 TaxID=3345823 RepID=UPI0036CDA4A2